MGARACLVDVGGGHRPRSTAGWDTSWPTAGRQVGPVGVVGLRRWQKSKGEASVGCEKDKKYGVMDHREERKTKPDHLLPL